MLNLVIGKAKNGKSEYIMDKMDKCAEEGKNVTLFIPSQMRMLAEEKYIACQNKPGIINIDFTTISSFVKDYNKKHNLTHGKSYISKMDETVILSKVIEENEDIFKIFRKCKNFEGFISTTRIYMDLLKKNNITKEKISNIDKSDYMITSLKLDEIYLLYEKYVNVKKNMGLIDSVDDIELFVDNFHKDKEEIEKSEIFFDSYNNFSMSELKFINKLLDMEYNVNIAITSNILDYVEDSIDEILDINKMECKLSGNENDIFYVYNLTVLNIIKMAKKLGIDISINDGYIKSEDKIDKNILYLSQNLFNLNINERKEKKEPENIDIIFTTNIYTQFESIADDIVYKIKNENARFSDFGIYTSSISEISNVISNIFIKHNIPFHMDLEYKLSDFVIYKYIYYILSMCVGKIDYNNLFNLLKLNLLDISLDEISIFENYCLEYNITDEYRFKLDIKENDDYDSILLNNLKNKIVNMYFELKSKLSLAKNSKDIVKIIYDHLSQNKILEKVQKMTYDMESSDDTKIKYYASLNKPLFDSICEIFDSICKVYDKMNVKKFFKIFKSIASDITKKSIPETMDEVELLDINVSKTSPKKYIYFTSVNEGKMPLSVKEDIIFSDRDLKLLKSKYDLSFKEDSISKIAMQNYNIYEAVLTAKEKISFYYLASNADGSSLRPSSVINYIKDIFDIKEKLYDENKTITYENLAMKLSNNVINEAKIDEETLAIYESLLESEKFKAPASYIRHDDNLSKESLDKLYRDNSITSSVSKIEQFKRCPFSYFMKYGLNLKERKVYKITSLDLGSFMHNVLERFSRYLVYENISWNMILDDEKYTEVLDKIIEEILEKDFNKHKESIKYAILERKLKVSMKKAVNIIAKGFVQSDFEPFAYELEFSDYSEYKPIEIELSKEKKVRLVGKIDRVDVAKIEENSYVRIVDYKSSAKDLTIDDVKEGISLQLMTYISAFIENSKENNIKPAGVMYFNLSDKFLKLSEYIKDESKIESKIIESLRMKGIFLSDIKVLEIMDKKLESQDRLINVSSRSIKNSKSSKSLLNEDEFDNIIKNMKHILKDILNEIVVEGNVKIEPNSKVDPCKYCVYGSICRKENMC